jgi:hypothetical protein
MKPRSPKKESLRWQGVAFKLLRGKESLLNFSVASTSLLNVKVGSRSDESRSDFPYSLRGA